MNIITTHNYIAGIFADESDAEYYIGLKPDHIHHFEMDWYAHVVYPFYLVEMGNDEFLIFQTEEEARAVPNVTGPGMTVYTVTQDYQPSIPWNDEMGSITHDHPDHPAEE